MPREPWVGYNGIFVMLRVLFISLNNNGFCLVDYQTNYVPRITFGTANSTGPGETEQLFFSNQDLVLPLQVL